MLTFKHAKRVGETCEGCDAFAIIFLMAFVPSGMMMHANAGPSVYMCTFLLGYVGIYTPQKIT